MRRLASSRSTVASISTSKRPPGGAGHPRSNRSWFRLPKTTCWPLPVLAIAALIIPTGVSFAVEIPLKDGTKLSAELLRITRDCAVISIEGVELEVRRDEFQSSAAFDQLWEKSLRENDAEGHYAFGMYLIENGLEDEALEHLKKATLLDAKHKDEVDAIALKIETRKEQERLEQQRLEREERIRDLIEAWQLAKKAFAKKQYRNALKYAYLLRDEEDQEVLTRAFEAAGIKDIAQLDAWISECENLEEDPEYKKRFNWENAWETKTAHYQVRTNAGPDVIKELAENMEKMYAYYCKIFKYTKKSTRRLKVYVFKNQEEFQAYAAKVGAQQAGGYYDPGNKEIVTWWHYTTEDWNTQVVLFHEGTHQFIDLLSWRDPPIWFNEGCAVYFENSQWGQGELVTGVIPKSRLLQLKEAIKAKQYTNFNELLTRQGFLTPLEYAQSWSMVYFLIHGFGGRNRWLFDKYWGLMPKGKIRDDTFVKLIKKKGETDREALDTFIQKWAEWVLALDPEKGEKKPEEPEQPAEGTEDEAKKGSD